MAHTSKSSEKEESNVNSAVPLNSLEVVKVVEVILNFVQTIYEKSPNSPELLDDLLKNPGKLLQILNHYSVLQKRCEDLEQRLSHAATLIGTKDTGATASSGHEHYELSRQYEILKGNFEAVSNQVFEFCYGLNPSFPLSERNKKISIIQGHLSKIILIDNFFPAEGLKNNEVNRISKQIINLIIVSSRIGELKRSRYSYSYSQIIREYELKLNDLVKNQLQKILINGLSTLTKFSEKELNQVEIIKTVEDWASKELKLAVKANPTLSKNLNDLAEKGINFVMNLTKATPAGRLWIEEKDTPFDPGKHEPHQMCGKSLIEFTIFPGYSIDSIVKEKALVFTNITSQ